MLYAGRTEGEPLPLARSFKNVGLFERKTPKPFFTISLLPRLGKIVKWCAPAGYFR